MTKVKKLSIKLPREDASATVVIDYAKAVNKGMSSNAATFPAPTVSMADLERAIEAAVTANVTEANRSDNTDAELNNKIVILRTMLSTLSVYVLFVANEDRYIAGLSGFELNKPDKTKHNPAEFTAKFVRPGADAGTAVVRIEERAGNSLFIVQLKVEDKWVMIDAFNELLFLVEGLPPGSSTLRIYGKKGKRTSPAVEIIVRAS